MPLSLKQQVYDASLVPSDVDLSGKAMVEVQSRLRVYSLLRAHTVSSTFSTTNYHNSYRVDQRSRETKKGGCCGCDDDNDDDENANKECDDDGCDNNNNSNKSTQCMKLNIGLGFYRFHDFNNNEIFGLHQASSDYLATSYDIQRHESIVLFHNDPTIIEAFLTELLARSEVVQENTFTTYKWDIRSNYWRNSATCEARHLDSVILPQATKTKLVSDLSRFLSRHTKAFYRQHGIPYRRSYLFHGLPGTGKTSLVQALAGRFHRNVAILQPTSPEMTDDSLNSAIEQLPANSIVVLEDIDALFDKKRQSKMDSKITFSGLLNALDGVGSANGQIFVLTTNLKDQLDAALIRKGRVDIHVEFGYATDEQIEMMWKSYYPSASELSGEFVRLLREKLSIAASEVAVTEVAEGVVSAGNGRVGEGALEVVTSELQHYFVVNMHSSPEEALLDVESIVREKVESMAEAKKAKEAEKEVEKEESKKDKDNNKDGISESESVEDKTEE